MQSPDENFSERVSIRPTRLIKHSQSLSHADKKRQYNNPFDDDTETRPAVSQPGTPATPHPSLWDDTKLDDPDANIPPDLFEIGSMSTMRLMTVSSQMRAMRPSAQANGSSALAATATVGQTLFPPKPPQTDLLSAHNINLEAIVSSPTMSLAQVGTQQQAQPTQKTILSTMRARTLLGLLVGIGMLFLISKFVNFPSTLAELKEHLTTTRGVIYALCAAASFIAAFSIRGTRWRLFLSRICDISVFKSIQIFWVAVFLNFLLPVQGGELGKSLILKRIKGIPISRSLPTVAMDKSLDLMPALIIMAAVPFIPGIHMSATLWIILGLVSGILLGIIFTVALMAWNRAAATQFIKTVLRVLPAGIGTKIEGFALGFVDSLLEGASNPRTFIPAILLTCLAVTCDGLFAWFAFLTVGVNTISFATAIFGYTTYNMFSILPTPPGQLGSNELWGVLVFGGLLGFPKAGVLAMFVFSHPLAALIMTTMCLISLSALGISIKSVMKMNTRKESA